MKKTDFNKYKAAVLGLIVGDALGVPVEFKSRSNMKDNPITGMIGYGTHNQPAGTWSDDSSMVIATMEWLGEMKDKRVYPFSKIILILMKMLWLKMKSMLAYGIYGRFQCLKKKCFINCLLQFRPFEHQHIS